MNAARSVAHLALVVMLSLAGAVSAHAADGVRLEVSVIHATKTPADPDPALADVQKDLARAFGGFTSFKRLQAESLTLMVSKKETLKLPNGEAAEFTYQGAAEALHRIRLAIPKSKVEVDLRSPFHKRFYQAGQAYEGGILILAMRLAKLEQ